MYKTPTIIGVKKMKLKFRFFILFYFSTIKLPSKTNFKLNYVQFYYIQLIGLLSMF